MCTYCPAPATQVDHVVPLALGGTNYIGNLMPACAPCNRAKGDNLLIEWRTGKKARRMRWQVPTERMPKPPKSKPLRVWVDPPPWSICPICVSLHVGHTYCSDECRAERNRRQVRDRYRKRQGLPVDPTRPTSRWDAA